MPWPREELKYSHIFVDIKKIVALHQCHMLQQLQCAVIVTEENWWAMHLSLFIALVQFNLVIVGGIGVLVHWCNVVQCLLVMRIGVRWMSSRAAVGGWLLSGGININSCSHSSSSAPYSQIAIYNVYILPHIPYYTIFTNNKQYLFHQYVAAPSQSEPEPAYQLCLMHININREPVTGYKCWVNRWPTVRLLCNTTPLYSVQLSLWKRLLLETERRFSDVCQSESSSSGRANHCRIAHPPLPLPLLTPTESQTYLSRSAGHPPA